MKCAIKTTVNIPSSVFRGYNSNLMRRKNNLKTGLLIFSAQLLQDKAQV